jgi:hypothetical protein
MPRLLRLLPVIALLLFCLLVFEKLAFSDMILARGDSYHYFYPYWDARNEAFRAGELPLWTADIFMGTPLLADPQIGTFYPPNWLMTPFTAPDGIRYSILLHVFGACLGTFILFRRLISPALLPAITAAAVFGLGGYLGAHVEQINQLQGLAWLPWLIYLLHRLLEGEKRFLLLLALAWALQIFSGHTQTTFLSGVTLGFYVLSYQLVSISASHDLGNQQKQAQNSDFRTPRLYPLKAILFNLLMLSLAAIGAILLAIPQLLPTLELIGMSNRGSGLDANQATAFSLPPWYLGRALLPSYDGQLFGEYIGYIGVIALVLAIYGALSVRKDKRLWFWIGLALLGMFFAFGRANPVYVYLAELPLFNFFRVPARWMALYALAMAMLAGYGILELQARVSGWKLGIAVLLVLALVGIAWYFPINPIEITGSAEVTRASYIGWGVALLILGLILAWKQWHKGSVDLLLAIAVVVELFLASRIMPYNDLAPRDVYLGQRFTISQLLALNEEQIPPPRMLSISGRNFDVGDKDTLQARFGRMDMDTEAQATAFTAIKSQEVLFPNLGLSWGIPTIDGYGGGLLPTIYYSQFTSLFLPEDSLRTVDGRLGEMMSWPDCRGACIPAWNPLALTDTGYLITDKVYDVWVDGVAYDTALAHYWGNGIERPDFEFTEIRVLQRDDTVGVFDWENLNLDDVLAVTAVDTRTGEFLQLQPRGFERILSSDIKIYQLEGSSRAYLASEVSILPDNWQGHEDALDFMQTAEFLSLESTVIHGNAEVLAGQGEVSFISYTPTRIEMTVMSDAEAYLILSDAYYPGWTASVNGEESPVYRTNVMFRGVRVAAGESTVVFEFVPMLWYGAMAFGGVVWALALGISMFLWRKGQANNLSPEVD